MMTNGDRIDAAMRPCKAQFVRLLLGVFLSRADVLLFA